MTDTPKKEDVNISSKKPSFKTVQDVLHYIQKNLVAPKGRLNKFGGYNFRNCEDIVEAVKSILPEGATLKLSDDIFTAGNRFYVKATASLCFAAQCESVTAYARECETRKGFGEDQITGAASSYARKYALNGLFMIDDSRDADETNEHGKEEKKVDLITEEQKQKLLVDIALCKDLKTLESVKERLGKDKARMKPDDIVIFSNAIKGKHAQLTQPEDNIPQ